MPSLKITWVCWLSWLTCLIVVHLIRGWAGKPEGSCLPSSLSCADNQESLDFVVCTVPKAKTTEMEITHSIKSTKLKLCNLWDYLDRKKDPHSPHNLVWVLVSLNTSAATEKKKSKDLLCFLSSIKCSYTHKSLTHPMNMRWLFKIF